jgi:hypothetical protein
MDEALVEGLALVRRVVLRGQVRCDLQDLQTGDLETLVLEPTEDPADEAALDPVGLDEQERAFHEEADFRFGVRKRPEIRRRRAEERE